MNGAQIHLLLNHLPVLVTPMGAALIVAGLIFKSRDVRDAGAWFVVASALSAIVAYLSGEQAEHVLKNYPAVSRLLIDDHAAAAFPALLMLEFTGAVSLGLALASLLKKTFAEKKWVWIVLVLLTLNSFVAMARVAHLGGLIHHEEIRATDRF